MSTDNLMITDKPFITAIKNSLVVANKNSPRAYGSVAIIDVHKDIPSIIATDGFMLTVTKLGAAYAELCGAVLTYDCLKALSSLKDIHDISVDRETDELTISRNGQSSTYRLSPVKYPNWSGIIDIPRPGKRSYGETFTTALMLKAVKTMGKSLQFDFAFTSAGERTELNNKTTRTILLPVRA